MINKIIKDGISFLLREQHEDGCYLSYSSSNPLAFEEPEEYRTTFIASLILSCVAQLPAGKDALTIREKGERFLLEQRDSSWSFNYWTRESNQAKQRPYPDDLDDTFCALTALGQISPGLFSGEALSKITQLLITVEQSEGGPYRTWLVPKTAKKCWLDVDLAVNANVAAFLKLWDITLPNLTRMLDDAIASKTFKSPYYPSMYPVLYFVARAYSGAKRDDLRLWLLESVEISALTPLELALVASSLVRLGASRKELAPYALGLKEGVEDRWRRPYPFCFDPQDKGVAYYAGSHALTVAFRLEALALVGSVAGSAAESVKSKCWQEPDPSASNTKRSGVANNRTAGIEKAIKLDTAAFCAGLPEAQRRPVEELMRRILSLQDEKSVALLPLHFRDYLCSSSIKVDSHEPDPRTMKERLASLGLAMVYGWLTYTIYDDIIDGEESRDLLPAAAMAQRRAIARFTQTVGTPKFALYVGGVFDKMDLANMWELANCRFVPARGKVRNQIPIPDYGDYSFLAERSLGYSLGPIAVLTCAGYALDGAEVRAVEKFFRHYLIARQLADDAHDWHDDLKVGQVNSCGALALRKYRKSKGAAAFKKLSPDMNELREVFWPACALEAIHLVEDNIAAARASIGEPLACAGEFFDMMLEPIDKMAKKTERECAQAAAFIRSFKGETR